jgi:hypothetical protein
LGLAPLSDGEIPLAQLSKDSYYDALWLGEADTQFIKSRIWPMWTLPVGIKSKIVKGRINYDQNNPQKALSCIYICSISHANISSATKATSLFQ